MKQVGIRNMYVYIATETSSAGSFGEWDALCMFTALIEANKNILNEWSWLICHCPGQMQNKLIFIRGRQLK